MITMLVKIIPIIRWPPLPISWLLRLARGFTSTSSWLLHLCLYSHHIVPRCLPVLTRTSSSQSLSRGNLENRCQQFRTNHERSVKWHLVHRALLHTVSRLGKNLHCLLVVFVCLLDVACNCNSLNVVSIMLWWLRETLVILCCWIWVKPYKLLWWRIIT